MNLTFSDLQKVMNIIAPLKIYSLRHDGQNDQEYEAYRDAVRRYPTPEIENELFRIVYGIDPSFSKNYAKALFDEYVFQRIDYNNRRVVMRHYAFIIQDELLKNKGVD